MKIAFRVSFSVSVFTFVKYWNWIESYMPEGSELHRFPRVLCVPVAERKILCSATGTYSTRGKRLNSLPSGTGVRTQLSFDKWQLCAAVETLGKQFILLSECPISSVKVVYIYHFHWRDRTLGKQYKLLSECLDCRTQLSFIKWQLCANASARGKRVKSLPSGTICSSCGTQDLAFRNWNTEYPREAM